MSYASTDLTALPSSKTLAVERLDRLFRSVSALIVALAALMFWNVGGEPGVSESPLISAPTIAPVALSREWVWKRPDASFDSMFQTRR